MDPDAILFWWTNFPPIEMVGGFEIMTQAKKNDQDRRNLRMELPAMFYATCWHMSRIQEFIIKEERPELSTLLIQLYFVYHMGYIVISSSFKA